MNEHTHKSNSFFPTLKSFKAYVKKKTFVTSTDTVLTYTVAITTTILLPSKVKDIILTVRAEDIMFKRCEKLYYFVIGCIIDCGNTYPR